MYYKTYNSLTNIMNMVGTPTYF